MPWDGRCADCVTAWDVATLSTAERGEVARRGMGPVLTLDAQRPARRKRKAFRRVLRVVVVIAICAVAYAGYTRLTDDDSIQVDEPRTLGEPKGDSLRVGDYEVTPTITLDATEEIRAMSMLRGAPSHGRYALVELELTYVGDSEGRPGFEVEAALRGGNGLTYDTADCSAVLNAPTSMELPTMSPGSTLVVTDCIDYAPDAVEDGQLVVDALLPIDATEATWPLD